MAVMRTFIVGAVLAACLAGPAVAQLNKQPAPNPLADDDKQKKKDAEQIDREYKATLRRVDKGGTPTVAPTDPWSNMRGTDGAKTNDSKSKR